MWEGIALALACSVDAFAAGFAYGSKGIHIPWRSGLLLAFISTVFFSVPLWLGRILGQFIPSWVTTAACFSILLILGAYKLYDGLVRRTPEECRADKNNDMTISPSEAAVLGVALSLDGLAVGLGAGVGQTNAPFVAVFATLVIGTSAIMGGVKLGASFSRILPFNISWVSGVILIGLAFLQFI